MAAQAAHTRWWQIFEIIVGLPFLAAIALDWIAPLNFPPSRITPAVRGGGALLIIAGAAVVVLARRELARQRQPTDPGQPTSALVTTGVFGVSRNPLYLGGAGALLGIALAANLPWGIALLLPALIAARSVLIVPEERYLARQFGDAYAAYAATVCRWLGRRQRP